MNGSEGMNKLSKELKKNGIEILVGKQFLSYGSKKLKYCFDQ